MTFEDEVEHWLTSHIVGSGRFDQYYRNAAHCICQCHQNLVNGKPFTFEGGYVLERDYGRSSTAIQYLSGSKLFSKLFKIHNVRMQVNNGSAKGSIGRATNLTTKSNKTEITLKFKDGKIKKFTSDVLSSSEDDITDLGEISPSILAPNDMLGRKIKYGDFVAYSSKSYGMTIGNISKISKEGKVYIKPILGGKIGVSWARTTESRVEYPNDLIILDDTTFREFMLIKLKNNH
jgi:hypothetical protein